MVDERLLRRVDLFLLSTGRWFLLTLVLGSFALLTVDVGVGVGAPALATVALTVLGGVASYLRSVGAAPDVRVEVR
jgi:hypothetical protein